MNFCTLQITFNINITILVIVISFILITFSMFHARECFPRAIVPGNIPIIYLPMSLEKTKHLFF